MARWMKNDACPRCRERGGDRKGDNLGKFDDGGFYCWSCGYGGKGIGRRPVEAPEESIEPFYPWSSVIPLPHVQKLTSMGFKPSEIQGFMYDYHWDRRIYPIYDRSKLIFYEARSLDREPKAIQKGVKPIHVLGSGERLVMVEDLLSAIKVARHTKSAPLWGSSLHKDWIPHLISLRVPVDFWLDADKYRTALKLSNTMKLVGVDSRVYTTVDDPKDLTDEQICATLGSYQLSE